MSSDQHLWSIICSIIIEGNSAVFKECTIKGETLPHGDIDIVAGQINTRGEIIWRFGVQIFAEDEEFFLDSPIGISAKTKRTLTTVPPSKSNHSKKGECTYKSKFKFLFYSSSNSSRSSSIH